MRVSSVRLGVATSPVLFLKSDVCLASAWRVCLRIFCRFGLHVICMSADAFDSSSDEFTTSWNPARSCRRARLLCRLYWCTRGGVIGSVPCQSPVHQVCMWLRSQPRCSLAAAWSVLPSELSRSWIESFVNSWTATVPYHRLTVCWYSSVKIPQSVPLCWRGSFG